MNRFDWDWVDTMTVFGLSCLITVAVVIGTFILKPHNVDYYYVGSAETSHSAICVKAHWTWNTDSIAFCSNSYNEALDFMSKANMALPKQVK